MVRDRAAAERRGRGGEGRVCYPPRPRHARSCRPGAEASPPGRRCPESPVPPTSRSPRRTCSASSQTSSVIRASFPGAGPRRCTPAPRGRWSRAWRSRAGPSASRSPPATAWQSRSVSTSSWAGRRAVLVPRRPLVVPRYGGGWLPGRAGHAVRDIEPGARAGAGAALRGDREDHGGRLLQARPSGVRIEVKGCVSNWPTRTRRGRC